MADIVSVYAQEHLDISDHKFQVDKENKRVSVCIAFVSVILLKPTH